MLSPFASGSEDWHNHNDYLVGRCVCGYTFTATIDGYEFPGKATFSELTDGASDDVLVAIAALEVGETYRCGGGAQPTFDFRRIA